jgi:hypothetical protein
MSFELANKYAEFQLPAEAKRAVKVNGLSLNAAKMAIFSDTEKLSNDDIDYYIFLKPERMENESFEDYQNRRTFTAQLIKHKTLVYDYSSYEQK